MTGPADLCRWAEKYEPWSMMIVYPWMGNDAWNNLGEGQLYLCAIVVGFWVIVLLIFMCYILVVLPVSIPMWTLNAGMVSVNPQNGQDKGRVAIQNNSDRCLYFRGYRKDVPVLWFKRDSGGEICYDRNWWCGTGLEPRWFLAGTKIETEVPGVWAANNWIVGVMIYGKPNRIFWSDGTLCDEENVIMSIRKKRVDKFRNSDSAQQVDSAEASTIAVPPSMPSGSPR